MSEGDKRSRITIDVVLPRGYTGEGYGRLLVEKTLFRSDARLVSADDYEEASDGGR